MIPIDRSMHAPLDILAVRTLLPPNRFSLDEIEGAFLRWLADRPAKERAWARAILRNTGIEWRHSCLTLEEVFTPCDLTESSRRYREHATALGTALLKETLDGAGIAPRDVDVLITTSCTGFMIPSVDAHMANALGMRPDLLRLPVTQMGCAAGASALMYAAEILRGRPGGVAAIVNIELPTNTMQHQDFSAENVVSTALFADGLACTLVRHGGPPGPARVVSWSTHSVPDSLQLLGYNLTSSGFRVTLDPTLPEVVAAHFEEAATSLLAPMEMSLRNIAHFVIHPGGVRILDRIEQALACSGGEARLSRETMRACGNMSSTTVMTILGRLLDSAPAPGPALLMSFGPGFSAHQVLLSIGRQD